MMNSEPDYACDLVNICTEENINQMEENINPQVTCELYKEDDGGGGGGGGEGGREYVNLYMYIQKNETKHTFIH